MFHRICWLCWIGGAVVIMLSRFEIVPANVGWAGFYIACGAAVMTYLPWGSQRQASRDCAILTKAMLESKDHSYEAAIAQFQQGNSVFLDGLTFAIRPGNELALLTVASLPAAQMDDLRAQQDADRALAAFEAIARLSPEIAAVASDKHYRVSLLSGYGASGVEICQVTAGQVEWKIKR